MKNVLRGAAAAAWLMIAAACPALAQSSPNWTNKFVPTAGQWNAEFAAKQDTLGYVPLNTAGGTMTGRFITAPPGAATSGLNLPPGSTPANPANGDMWVTNAGLFVRVAGVTIGPLWGGTTSSFMATAPLNVTFPGGLVTYGLNFDSTLTVTGGNLGLRLPNPNTWTGLQTFSAGVSIATGFSAPGLVKNSDLMNASTTVNGQTCTLGGNCTINASATSITLGNTAISGGVSTRVLFDSAGVLGEYAISGSGSVAMTNSPTFVTPTLGAAVGTSLALGGATLGSNALAVTGASQLTGAVNITGAATGASLALGGATIGSNALAVTGAAQFNGAVNMGGGLTVTSSFTAAGLVTFADMATAAVASAAQYLTGAANTLVPASVIYQAETTTTFGASITFDFSTFINTAVTLTGNITTMTLANVKAGQAGTIAFIQDSTGSRTAVFNSIFKFAGGATPSLTSTPNAVDVLSYSCRSATFCVASLITNVR
jgi:hypothetical protein